MVDVRKKSRNKRQARIRRHARVRKQVSGVADRPRLAVFRSGKHIYAQVIDDDAGRTLASASSLGEQESTEIRSEREKIDAANAAIAAEAAAAPASADDAPADGKKKKEKSKKPEAKQRQIAPKPSNIGGAAIVGKALAERCKTMGIETVVFDRGGFRFHGRVKALADAARKHGLKF